MHKKMDHLTKQLDSTSAMMRKEMSELQKELQEATEKLSRRIVEGAQKTSKEIRDLNDKIGKVSLQCFFKINN